MSFTSRLTRLMDQRTTRIMEKEIIDFNIDTISNQPELFSCEQQLKILWRLVTESVMSQFKGSEVQRVRKVFRG